jgi:hypothetical protein
MPRRISHGEAWTSIVVLSNETVVPDMAVGWLFLHAPDAFQARA